MQHQESDSAISSRRPYNRIEQAHELNSIWSLICPSCCHPLERAGRAYFCPACQRTCLVNDNVIYFSAPDAFYEKRYPPFSLNFSPDERTLPGKVLLYLFGMHYFWYIRKHVPYNARILDVGCGAGMRYLSDHWQVAGIEISSVSAREAAKHYDLVMCLDSGSTIPLEANTVDAVVSRFFLEHLSLAPKSRVLDEFYRVLRPGGVLITLQDCESNNLIWKWAKKDTLLFTRQFIQDNGHYGLMYASENLELFERSGFQIIEWYAANKTPLINLPILEWMQPYRSKSRLANVLLGLAHQIYLHRWLNFSYTFCMTVFDDLIGRFLPTDHACYLLAVCQKGE